MGNGARKGLQPERLKPPICVPLESFSYRGPIPMVPFVFDNSKNEWIKISEREVPVSSDERETLKIITFNVWFSDWKYSERFSELCSIMKQNEADIICLQEVTVDFLKFITSLPWVRNNYYISDWNGEFIGDYGVCILTRLYVQRMFYLVLPTQMGRNCVVAQFTINEKILGCSTVHLESLANAPYRKKQLEVISKELENFQDTAILLGDFNFDAKFNFSHHLKKRHLFQQNIQVTTEMEEEMKKSINEQLENEVLSELLPKYQDVWNLLHIEDPGYTYDSEKNEMVKQLNGYEQMRYDRIMFRSTSWKPQSISLLGTKRIEKMGEDCLYPSDHFGLMLELSYSKSQM